MTISIQRCQSCGTFNYPAHAVCGNCLSDALADCAIEGRGVLLALSTVHHSLDPEWRAHLPVQLATVDLDCGVQVICFAEPGLQTPARVCLAPSQDRPGVWIARAQDA
ncbi:zinc ribbon domain-containing protein [Novosphingobium sp. 1949]|uniref:Zinc ribbon domain-containing protein n=1 Tax=Novosphingobium organovorum TaxID=2930092 RepID=A0ABT0BBL0_9SPHN|nr:zinc ribbon domain-containing protein [Novosphingobium organovorum]MCJ2182447.1 zinc ribbon domain-containing protein [Novosphingobium organovorum]